MGASEQINGEGYETDRSSNKVEVAVVNTMHRAASVDDLFAPFWGLNVHANGESHHSSSPSASAVRPPPDRSSSEIRDASSAAITDVSSTTSGAAQPAITHMTTSSSATSATHRIDSGSGPAAASVQDQREGITSDLTKLPLRTGHPSVSSSATEVQVSGLQVKSNIVSGESSQQQSTSERALEADSATRGSPSTRSSSHFTDVDGADVKPSVFSLEPEQFHAHTSGARGSLSTGRPYLIGRGVDATLPPSQSTSDDDQLNGTGLDERKQKRMLSNRESARRSRLRKQQHLDELRTQVAKLRAENIDMMARYGMASQRCSQITGENNVLRAHAMELSRKLQQVHHTVATQHPNELRSLGIQPGPSDQFASGHLSPYYQPLGLDLLP